MVTVLALERSLLYLTIIAGFVGAAFLAVEAGPIHLFPYRFLLPFLWMLFAIGVLFNRGRVKISHIKVRIYLQFLVFWLLYAVFSLGWAASKEAAIRDIIFLFMAVSVIFLVVYYLNSLQCLERFYYLWLLVFVVLLALGIWETVTGRHLTVSVLAQMADPRVRFMPTATFYNTNDYATYLSLSLPFVLVWIRYSRGLISRLIETIVLAGGLYLLVATSSRANYLAVLAGFGFYFLFVLGLKAKIKALVLVISVVLALLVAFPNEVQGIFTIIGIPLDILGTFLSGPETSPTSVRLNLIRNALIFLTRSFGFGVGAGNVEYHMANFAVYDTLQVYNVHNWWVEVLVNYGLFVFAGCLAFFFSLLFSVYTTIRKLKNSEEKMIGEGLLVGLVNFFLASVSSSSVMALRPLWIFLAFALAFLNYSRTKDDSTEKSS